MFPSAVLAQSVWRGGGATTQTSDYNRDSNWGSGSAPASAPIGSGQSARFAGSGSATIVVTGTIVPDSWLFSTNSQSYVISGGTVNFGNAATLTNNANAGQSISISNR